MPAKHGLYATYIKRLQDVLVVAVALVVLCPLLLVLTLVVRLTMGSPVLFYQERPGRNGKVFRLYKFRTMNNARDESGALLDDSQRLTGFGEWLRATSLDELPELFNVLRGDMALVGPRPLLVEYLDLYTPEQARRHEVRPGLTGLAQVSGRNALSWEDRFRLDVEYVDGVSFTGDWAILFQTVGKVIKREGISSETSVTMERFTGSAEQGDGNG